MNDVTRWLYDGAEVREGLRLLSLYAPNPYLERIVTANPGLYGKFLKKALEPYADSIQAQAPLQAQAPSGYRFREEWPFLAEPDCPMELKILANDKITAYHKTLELHQKLFSCTTLEDCFDTAKNLLKNFQQNRLITAEFTFYRESGEVLGKHPVFQLTKQFDGYRKMSVVALVRERENLKGAIWRAESEIRRGDRPHLKESRLERIAQKRQQLEVVERMIQESDKPAK